MKPAEVGSLMNERTIFIEALEQDSLERRAEYLAAACAGDVELRQRVEALLASHDEPGSFLVKTGPEHLAQELAAGRGLALTDDGADSEDDLTDDLEFLSPAKKVGSLGQLGHYDIQEVIGRGGMGVVLRAFDERLQRVVAIKVMAAQLATSATARKRFTREAQAVAAVSHEHVVTIHAVEEANGRPYIVMHYVAGTSLEERIERGGPLELHEILRIGLQTASGLAAAHAQGLIHRDIKPANILLENGVERVKITDFGLARAAADASLTQTGAVAGTPNYMAPEQARGESLDARTDLFSLGSVLYTMCTGHAPFRASGSMAVLKRVCEDIPTPIRATSPLIPEWLTAIIDKLHAKEPAERFQTAAELADLLGRHLAHLQHPSVAKLPALVTPAEHASSQPRRLARRIIFRSRWAVAASVLLCGLSGISLTEATGVTELASTVIRVLTPQGTLLVEVDDPAVKVTIEGDGGLVITGAGAQEVRLHPGSYQVLASKDGKQVKREVVTITQGNTRVVNVSVESQPQTAASLPTDEIRRFEPYWGGVMCVAVSPDGQRALFGGDDTLVWLVDLGGQDKPRSFEGHTKQVLSVAFSPDGRFALSGGQDATVRLWDVESGQELRQFVGHTASVWEVAFSPDGRLAASGGGHLFEDGKPLPANDTEVRLWDVETGTELRRLTGHNGYVLSIAFSQDGKQVLTGCSNQDPIIRLWDVATGKELGRLEGHLHGVCQVVFSADGRRALSAGADRTIRLWDVETRTTIGRFLGHSLDVTGVAFSPDERYCVSSSWDRTIRVWDVESRKELHRIEGHLGSVRAMAASPDGKSVLSGAEDGTVRLWQLPAACSPSAPRALK